MKLIIKESKRNKVVTKWLNKYYNNLFIKEYPRWGVMDFFTTDEPKSKVFVYESGVLLIINPNLIDELNKILHDIVSYYGTLKILLFYAISM